MDHVQNGGEDEVDDIVVVPMKEVRNATAEKVKSHYQHVNQIYDDERPHKKYTEELNSRTKRAASPPRYQERNTCSLYIQTDPLIWRHIRESIPDVSF
jgi:hypothetical protein